MHTFTSKFALGTRGYLRELAAWHKANPPRAPGRPRAPKNDAQREREQLYNAAKAEHAAAIAKCIELRNQLALAGAEVTAAAQKCALYKNTKL